MTMKFGIMIMPFILIAGCEPAQKDYENVQRRSAELESKVGSLTQEVERLSTELAAKNKELEDIKFGSRRLLIEAKAAAPLLKGEEGKIVDAEPIESKAEADMDKCIFDGTRLPPNYNGTNISNVLKAFARSPIKTKDEYETTINYKNRVAKEIEAVANPLQCVLLNNDYGTKYDADKKRWVISMMSFIDLDYSYKSNMIGGQYQFIVNSRSTPNGSYIGANAFGVEMEITKTKYFKEGVTFPIHLLDKAMLTAGARKEGSNYTAHIPMSLDKARSISKEDIKFLVQYIWSPDFVIEEESHHAPNINAPYQDQTEIKLIYGKPIRVAIVNQKTGEILAYK